MPKFKKNPSPIMKNMEYYKTKFAESEAKSPFNYVGYEDYPLTGDAYAGEEGEFNPRMYDFGYERTTDDEESTGDVAADEMAANLQEQRRRSYMKEKSRKSRKNIRG